MQLIQIPLDTETYQTALETARELNCTPDEVIRAATREFLLKPLTRKEAAVTANISLRTLDNWLKQGLCHVKVGRIVRIPRTDLYAWLTRHKSLSPSTPEPPAASRGRTAKTQRRR